MKSIRKSLALAFAGALTLAACAGSDSADGEMKKLGDGEGAVNLIAWAGYVENGTTDPAVDWVTGFETETGSKLVRRAPADEEHPASV